jgi:hypothetical protein
VKRFRYWLDPLCVGGCALYALNRWGVKPHTQAALFQCWFNDALLIPCALPLLLFAQRRLGLRRYDDVPTGREILGHLVVWAVLFEVVGPHWLQQATGDPLDVLAYSVGGLLAWLWWRHERLVTQNPDGLCARRRMRAC